jgi:hypothetical protein
MLKKIWNYFLAIMILVVWPAFLVYFHAHGYIRYIKDSKYGEVTVVDAKVERVIKNARYATRTGNIVYYIGNDEKMTR